MTEGTPYRGNGPTVGMTGDGGESDDLKSIRRDMEMHRLSGELWKRIYPDGDRFRREFEQVAEASQDWQAATFGQRYRALRILVHRFGRADTYLLTLMAAAKSQQDWVLDIRERKDAKKSDGGKRDHEAEQRHSDYIIGSEVYKRMKAGQSKAEAIAAVKEDYRTGAPYPSNGGFPSLNRTVRNLPGPDAIEKMLNRFRHEARRRGYVDPYAASGLIPFAREPDLKLNDIPNRGRPRNK